MGKALATQAQGLKFGTPEPIDGHGSQDAILGIKMQSLNKLA